MKHVKAIIAVFMLCVSVSLSATAQQDGEPDPNFFIYLCFGQSNMEAGARPEPRDEGVDKRFRVLAAVDMPEQGREKGRWYTAEPPLNRGENGLGPVDFFGRAMVEHLPEDHRVGVINVSVAGAKIELWGRDSRASYLASAPDWMKNIVKQYDNDPYRRLVEMAKIARRDGVVKGVLLHQGESNAGDQAWPGKVKAIYDRLMADLDLDPDQVPLLAGELVSAEQGGVCAGFNTDVLASLPSAVPNAHIISSAGCESIGDGLHFSLEGFRKLGRRYAMAALGIHGFQVQAEAETGEPDPAASALPLPLKWEASGELVLPPKDDRRDILAIKDPSVVRFNDRWHIYATTASNNGWQMVYLSFADWEDANDAEPFFMDDNPGLRGYHCAPQVFYFEPHQKWYLIFQSQQPQYCTADDLSDPASWTRPTDFFEGKPASAPDLWIDYYVICDDTHAYLFFTGDNGKLYRSRTTIEQFPKGMSDPVVVMEEENRFHLFEGSAHYKLKGTDQYLTIIEAIGQGGARFYRGFVSDRLDGEWNPVADTWDNPFAGETNVTFPDGVEKWTRDISHGELIREGYDQKMIVDPNNLKLLFQGQRPSNERLQYHQLPYRLGILTLIK